MSPGTKRGVGISIAVVCGLLASAFTLLFLYQFFNPHSFVSSDLIPSLFSCSLCLFGLSLGMRFWELSRWMLIYTSPQMAIILNKEKIDLHKFQRIVRSVPGLILDFRKP